MTDNKPYPDLPPPDFGRARRLGAAYFGDAFTADQMRAYVDADRAMRAAEPPHAAIGQLLSEAMDLAVSNGANSISMPDHLVEIAAWLSGVAQAAPAAVAPDSNHDALRCAVGNCTFNGEVTQHAATCPKKPAAVAGPDCQRCKGSGEDPEGYYDQSRGPDGDTHDGPCRACGGSGEAPTTQAPAVAGPVVAYRISDPHEPDLGSWLSEKPGATWCKSEPLVTAAPTQAAPPACRTAGDVIYRWQALDYSGYCYGSNPPEDLPARCNLTAFHRQPEAFRDALHEISATGNLTATPQQFARHLQKIARDALTGVPILGRDDDVAALRSALNAMLTQFGMHEDEFSKPTFDQARRALATQGQEAAPGADADAEDAARLDWIFRQADEFSCSIIVDAPGDGEYVVYGMGGAGGQGETPREAIDAARAQQEGK